MYRVYDTNTDTTILRTRFKLLAIIVAFPRGRDYVNDGRTDNERVRQEDEIESLAQEMDDADLDPENERDCADFFRRRDGDRHRHQD